MFTALLVAVGVLGGALHPMDGPDADVRVRITEDEVRFTCAFNLAFVDAVVDVPREQEGDVAGPEKAVLRDALVEHLSATNRVEIDGVLVNPVAGEFAFLPAPLDLVPLFPGFGARALAKVQVELSYPAKSAPESVRFHWGEFPPNATLLSAAGAPPIEITAQLRAEGRDSLVTLRVDQPSHLWTASGVGPEDLFLAVPTLPESAGRSIPVASFLCFAAALILLGRALRRGAARRGVALGVVVLCAAGAAARDLGGVVLEGAPEPLDQAQARAVFRPLHANIYRAFDYDDEGAIYDALARSVEGPLLRDLYDQVYRSLLNQEADGARSSVQAVRLLEASVVPKEDEDDARHGFDVDARWQVDGAVYHWGHAHERTNEYRARYGVRAGADGWRIAQSRVLEERRVDAAPLTPPPADGLEAQLFIEPASGVLPEGVQDL